MSGSETTEISKQCGNPSLRLSSLFARDADGGVLGWFEGLEIQLSVNARASIRKTCDLLGLGDGDEILVPAYNCGSEIDPLLDCGGTVTLYRVRQDTTLDMGDIERRITARTKAIYLIHYFGFPQSETAAVKALCERRGLFLIEDCALALYGELDGRKLGTFGDVAVFCFYKFYPTIGGGALVVNNQALNGNPQFHRPAPAAFVWKAVASTALRALLGTGAASRLTKTVKKMLGRHRPSPTAKTTQSGEAPDNLPDMPAHYYFDPAFRNASISRLTLRALSSFSSAPSISIRRKNYWTYLELLRGQAGIECLFPQLPDGVCPLTFPIIVRDRDTVCDRLNELHIAVTPWWKGYHQRLNWKSFTEARTLKEGVLALPLHQYIDRRHIVHICRHVINLTAPRNEPAKELADAG